MNAMAGPGKRALVTGGGSGVGAAIALALAAQDVPVVITGRNAEALDAMASTNSLLRPMVADATDENCMNDLLAAMAADGGAPDIVIANAGMAESAPIGRTSVQLWQDTMNVNLTGVFLTFRAALSVMDKRSPGRLIAIASTAGLKGYPYVSAYCAAKHGVIGLVRAMALELAKTPVTVNAICPGFTETPMLQRSIDKIVATTGKPEEDARQALAASNPQGRFIQPQEVAATVQWLCQAEAASVNGQALALSGGEI